MSQRVSAHRMPPTMQVRGRTGNVGMFMMPVSGSTRVTVQRVHRDTMCSRRPFTEMTFQDSS